MRSRIKDVVMAGLALSAMTAVAMAQGPPGMPPGGGPGGPGGPSLVMNASVQEELALTDKQKAQLKRLDEALARKRRETFSEAGEGGFDPLVMRSAMNNLRRDQESATSKILNKRQKERLSQIELQREGVLAVAKQDVATKLKLTAAQSKKVKAIVDEMRQAQARSMPRPPGGGPGGGPGGPGGGPPPDGGPGGPGGGPPPDGGPGGAGGGPPNGGPGGQGGGPPQQGGGSGGQGGRPNFDSPEIRAQFAKMRETQEKLRKAATEQINKVLTTEQKAAFDKMLGAPFDLSTLRPGPGPGGPPDGPPPSEGGDEQPKSKSQRRRATR